MSAIAEEEAPPAPTAVPRPEVSRRLTRPLHVVAGRARMLALLQAAVQLITCLLTLMLLLAIILGSIRELPVAVAFAACALAGLAFFAGLYFFFRPTLRRRDLAATARLVDGAIPETNERLSSALELSQEEDPRYQGSPELIAALVRQAEQAAAEMDPHAVVSAAGALRWSIALLPLVLLWFILLLVSPTTTLGLRRLIQPWVAAAPLPTATLEVDPQNTTIAQGDSVKITLNVIPAAGTLPSDKPVDRATITCRFTAGSTNEDVTTDMSATGNRSFRAIFDNVQQTFSYRIAALDGRSPAYTVTVQQRPAVNTIQVDYTYPDYIGRAPYSDKSRDGAIDALVGTRVKLTIDATQPLSSAKLVISDNLPDPGTLVMKPVAGSPTQFTAEFTVRKSTDYRLRLTNQQGLDNGDTTAHAIVAHMDAAPQVTINSPASTQSVLKVRPDDVVPIKFTATDDFALTRIEAITQVDQRPPTITLLPLASGQTNVNGAWTLSLPDLLRTVAVAPPALPAPRRITYQFRVMDNRAPDPQTGLSAKQTLDLDRTVTPLAARQDTQAARTLGEAVTQAAKDIDNAKSTLDTLQHTAATRPLTDGEKQQLADARRQMANAAQSLAAAADKTEDSRLAEMARQAKAIADKPLRDAGEHAAAGQIAADQPEARNKSLEASSKSLADARGQLDALAKDLSGKAKDQPLAHELERIAREQRRLADALAAKPNDPALLAQQRQLQQDLERVIREHPELQKPAADAAQAKVEELQKKLQEIQQAQQPLNEQAHAQEAAAGAQDKLNELAKKQEALNQQMNQFAQQQADKLKQANARTPTPGQTDPIGKDLQNHRLADAAQSQNAAASQMEQAAQQLENTQKRQGEGRSPEQLAEAAKDAEALRDQAAQLQKDIEEAKKNHNPPTLPSDPANQKAAQLAEQARRQAQQMSQSPATSAAGKEAAAEAEAAKRDAARGNAASAQQHLANATNRLAQAAKAAAPQGDAAQRAKENAQAIAKARELGKQQRELAEQTARTDRAIDQAASSKANAPQVAQQQQAVAEKMEDAARTAKELQQQTQGGAPEVAQRAKQTADTLQKAAQAQRAAAKANQAGKTEQARSQQQQAEKALTSAQQSSGSPSSSAKSGGEQAGGKQGSSGSASSGSSASSAGSSGSSSSGSPGQSGSPGDGKGASAGSGAGSEVASNGGGAPAESATAQAVQSARNAQAQAASGNPAAARQAAEQLAQASQQLLSGGGASGAASSAGSAGQSAGSPSANGSSPTSASRDEGLAPGANGKGGPGRVVAAPSAATPPKELPKAVEEIGVSPSDWARLPPTMQEQLLNSAQQSGPPSYRDMIKNYYSRIARMQDQPGDTP